MQKHGMQKWTDPFSLMLAKDSSMCVCVCVCVDAQRTRSEIEARALLNRVARGRRKKGAL
jgi:hypothetical protein